MLEVKSALDMIGKTQCVFFSAGRKMPQVRALICNVTNTVHSLAQTKKEKCIFNKHARCRFASVRLDLLCKLPPLLQHTSRRLSFAHLTPNVVKLRERVCPYDLSLPKI